jgi:hypothetical protein
MMIHSTLDAGIPVLTEVIAAPQQAAPPAHGIAPDETIAETEFETEHMPAEAEDWIEDEWNRMERKISCQILEQLMTRLDTAIEEQVRNSLADVLQTTIDALATDIKRNLQQSLERVIADAVAQEVARIQFLEK